MTNIIILIATFISIAISLSIINSFINFKLKNKLSENESPISTSYVKGITFISISLLMGELIETFQTLTKILPNQLEGDYIFVKEISFYCIFFGIILITFIIIFWLSTLLFSMIKKGRRIFVEIANNDLQSIILFSAILLAITIAVKNGLTPLLDEFIPYPKMPIYR